MEDSTPPPRSGAEDTASAPSYASAPPITPHGTGVGGVVTAGVRCVNCGYELGGLHESGACPECGESIGHSLKGELMLHAPKDYLASLHRGSVIVLTAIILQLLMAFTALGLGVTGSPPWVLTLVGWLQFAISGALLWGWWLLSSPMPAASDRPQYDQTRLWVRAMLIANVVLLGVSAVFDLVSGNAGASGSAMPSGSVLVLSAGISILALVVWIGGFIVEMLYLAWLAKRVPDAAMHKRAKLLVWLGPVLSTVGILLIGLGPLIALVMYWNLVDRFRKAFKHIRAERERLEQAPDASGV